MKNLGRCVFVIVFFFFFQGIALGARPIKIGVVDMNVLQQKSTAFKKVRDELKKKLDAMQQKLNVQKNALLKMEEDYRKQSMMLSLDAQEDKKTKLERKQRYYKYLFDDFNIEMKNAEQMAKQKISRQLSKILKKIAEDGHYTIIFERRTPGLLFYDDSVDVTNQVIKAYDSQKQQKQH